jgi:hypothetical protein
LSEHASAETAGSSPPAGASQLLRGLIDSGQEGRIAIGDIVENMGSGGFGLLLLAFALPCCLPLPPGLPSTAGWIIAFIAFNMLAGRDNLWLPRVLSRLSIDRQTLSRIVHRGLPHLERMERLCRRRAAFAIGRTGRALVGAAMLVPAALLILPIPIFGNVPPGIAAAVIAVAVCQGDGLIALAGAVLALLVAAVTGVAAWAVLHGIAGLL